ncbi:hypothetical protein [Streptomyces sp. NPDC002088]|uniref:hypothetical protein n=1 Tax=Streptomyces sp. NPDC002088 TaxID=3154665 RepID=UPI003329AD07
MTHPERAHRTGAHEGRGAAGTATAARPKDLGRAAVLAVRHDTKSPRDEGSWGGYYAAQVTDLKRTGGEWFAVLAGGINHFVLPALLEVAVEAAVLPVAHWLYSCPRPERRNTPVSLAGPLCTPEDILARGITADRLRVGDIVVFPTAGAYGWEFAVRGFLGHPPAVRATAQPTSVRTSGAGVPAGGVSSRPEYRSSHSPGSPASATITAAVQPIPPCSSSGAAMAEPTGEVPCIRVRSAAKARPCISDGIRRIRRDCAHTVIGALSRPTQKYPIPTTTG